MILMTTHHGMKNLKLKNKCFFFKKIEREREELYFVISQAPGKLIQTH